MVINDKINEIIKHINATECTLLKIDNISGMLFEEVIREVENLRRKLFIEIHKQMNEDIISGKNQSDVYLKILLKEQLMHINFLEGIMTKYSLSRIRIAPLVRNYVIECKRAENLIKDNTNNKKPLIEFLKERESVSQFIIQHQSLDIEAVRMLGNLIDLSEIKIKQLITCPSNNKEME